MRWLQVSLAGILADGLEEFQHGFQLGKPGADPDLAEPDQLILANQIAGYWALALAAVKAPSVLSLKSLMPTDLSYTAVGVAQHDQTTVLGAPTVFERNIDPTSWFFWDAGVRPKGTSAAVSLPFNSACAVTLQTANLGRGGRGRTYLPPFATNTMMAGGLFTLVARQTAALAMQDLFERIIAGTPHEPIVVSVKQNQLRRIASVNCGSVPDSQRRRRRSLAEVRYAPPPLVFD